MWKIKAIAIDFDLKKMFFVLLEDFKQEICKKRNVINFPMSQFMKGQQKDKMVKHHFHKKFCSRW